MPDFLLQLGHAPELSYAEISAVQERLKTFTSLEFAEDVVLAQADSVEQAVTLVQELGGVIRLAEILSRQEMHFSNPALAETLTHWFVESGVPQRLREQSKRPMFGMSLIGAIDSLRHKKMVQQDLQTSAQNIKNLLREEDVSSRFILPFDKGELQLNAAQVDKNQLLSKGGEIVLHWSPNQTATLALTRWIQEYEEFSYRDYGRPQRDPRSGMLPPKLSRMLINLARTPDTQTLLDPFCGSGSLLMEAALLGLKATGVDSSKKAIEDTHANWKWVQTHLKNLTGTVKVFKGDARQLHKQCQPLYFDACVTEPFLGPPLKKPLNRDQFRKLSQELSELYLRALGEIRTVVKPGARVVFIVPRFRVEGVEEHASLNILPYLKLQGYKILDPLDRFVETQRRATVIYSRPKQWVQREIFVLQA
ncbi:MAG: TRM11 family SAM-dependent methyltransferase [bacterium]